MSGHKRRMIWVSLIAVVVCAAVFAALRFWPQRALPQEEALSLLEAHLVDLGWFGPGLTGAEDSGETFCFDGLSDQFIDGVEAYSADVRWSGGVMSGRLLMSLAVSTDGTRYFQYDPSEDTWMEI